MKTILFISIAFPPKLDPECIQTARYYKYLAKTNKYNINIVTSKSPTLFMPDDPYMKKFSAPIKNTMFIKLWEWRYLNFILNKFFSGLIQLPDSKFSFHLSDKSVIKNTKRPNIIYSRSFPLSSSILAYKLAKHYRVPWVMHLSDPWVESPLHSYKGFAKKKNQSWEKACFNRANIITFTSEKTIDIYTKKYPKYKGKYVLTPNVYDPEDVVVPTNTFLASKLKFVYTGGLANTRTAELVLKVIKDLREHYPKLLSLCEFVFAGDLDTNNRTLFNNYKDESVKHLGILSFKKAIELQRSAHVLLVIDSQINNPDQSMFFPSKLLDYWASQKPILAISDKESTTSSFIRKYNLGKTVGFGQSEYLKKAILEYINSFKKQELSKFKTPAPTQEYSATYNVELLLNLFNKLSQKK